MRRKKTDYRPGRRRRFRGGPGLAVLVGLAACGDFPSPAELDHAQILAMRADPPAIPAGGRARLSVLVADAAGEAVDLPTRWDAVGLVAGAPALGRIEVDDGGAVWLVAPDPVPEPVLAVAQVTVAHPERELVGIKGLGIGLEPTANPHIAAITVDGVPLGEDGVMELFAGGTAALAVAVEPAPAADATYAWYATVGEIDPYRQPITEFAAPEESGQGWLFVVVRDGLGGVNWRSARIAVD